MKIGDLWPDYNMVEQEIPCYNEDRGSIARLQYGRAGNPLLQ